MERPHENKSNSELESIFNSSKHSIRDLRILLRELKNRDANDAKGLYAKVTQHLFELTTAAFLNDSSDDGNDISSHEEPAALASTIEVTGELEEPKEPKKIMRPLGTLGLPDPIAPSVQDDLKLKLTSEVPQLDRYIEGLTSLIQEMKKPENKGKGVRLKEGERKEISSEEFIYAFPYSGDANIAQASEVELDILGKQIPVSIIGIKLESLFVSIGEDFGPKIPSAVLHTDSSALYQKLVDSMSQVKKGERSFNLALADAVVGAGTLLSRPTILPGQAEKLNSAQELAYHSALKNSVTRIWGPPGTGKTFTLASIVRTFMSCNKRILICSNTNKAVDQVLLRVCDDIGATQSDVSEGRIVRVGSIADSQLKENYERYVTVDGIFARRSEKLHARMRDIDRDLEKLLSYVKESKKIIGKFEALKRAQSEVIQCQKELDPVIILTGRVKSETLQLENDITSLESTVAKATGFSRLLLNVNEFKRQIQQKQESKVKLLSDNKENLEKLTILQVALIELQRQAQDLKTETSAYDLNAAQKIIANESETRKLLLTEKKQIESDLPALKQAILKEAKVVGATCTKLYLDSTLGQFDLVIIDEASMVLTPIIWFSSGLSSERVIVCGDFNQIPPILPSDEKVLTDLLSMDVIRPYFEKSDPTLVMLTEQRRMNTQICQLVSEPMYSGKLVTEESRAKVVAKPLAMPFENPLTIIDTSNSVGFENFDGKSSRYNLTHARIARDIALYLQQHGELQTEKSVGICTPSAAQARICRSMLSQVNLTNLVTAATVHSFQGDQLRSVIIDIPESSNGKKLGRFTQGAIPYDSGARLLNVAVSRAQENIIVIANLAHLDRLLPSHAMLRSILFEMENKGQVIPAEKILALGNSDIDLQGLNAEVKRPGLFDEQSFYPALKADMASAKKSISIYSGFITQRRVDDLKALLAMKSQENVAIDCVIPPAFANGSIPRKVGEDAMQILKNIGCKVKCRRLIHEKAVIIDGKIVWHGSLNILSHAHTRESMLRIVNEDLAGELLDSLNKVERSSEG